MRHTSEAIRHFLSEQSLSGLTVADFCSDNGLKVPTFYLWRKRYRTADTVESIGFCTITPKIDEVTTNLCLPSGLRLELTGLTISEIAELVLEIDRAHA